MRSTRTGRVDALPPLVGARTLAVGVAMLLLAAPIARAAEDDGTATVVVTTDILGSLVSELVGEAADVRVLMPSGSNPHTWEPSAREVELLLGADLIVSNGLDLEEGLTPVLESAAAEGVTWFEATDHVTLLQLDQPHEHDHEGESEEAASDTEGDDGVATDPHIWTDPTAMADVVDALAPVLVEAGIDVAAGAEVLVEELAALDARVAEILAAVPPEDRLLVTGHRSLGYFAERYGFEQVGSVVASLSTDAEPTPRELAELIEEIRTHDVAAVFAEAGTPASVAQAVAADGGAALVELSTAGLPEDGSYADFMTELATTIAGALGGEGR
jgi:zinc/manganese transport system substrate-binding protein